MVFWANLCSNLLKRPLVWHQIEKEDIREWSEYQYVIIKLNENCVIFAFSGAGEFARLAIASLFYSVTEGYHARSLAKLHDGPINEPFDTLWLNDWLWRTCMGQYCDRHFAPMTVPRVIKLVVLDATMTHFSRGSRGASYKWQLHKHIHSWLSGSMLRHFCLENSCSSLRS